MSRTAALLFLTVLSFPAAAQKTIEGYWQDSARRILFDRTAPAGYAYGKWTALDPAQTYPSAKHIRPAEGGFEVLELLYDDEEAVRVLRSSGQSIEFIRTNRWSGCSALNQCALEGEGLLCKLRTACGGSLVWQGEERYERRASCERTQARREAQGIPSVCR